MSIEIRYFKWFKVWKSIFNEFSAPTTGTFIHNTTVITSMFLNLLLQINLLINFSQTQKQIKTNLTASDNPINLRKKN